MSTEQPTPDAAGARQLEAAGNLPAAMDAFMRLGLFHDAARVAWARGLPADAADFSVRGGHHYEAGLCYEAAGLVQPALHQLLRTSPADPRHRDACLRVIALCTRAGGIGMRVDAFLAPFLLDAPRDARELDALYALALLYRKASLDAPARRALERILVVNPAYKDALAQLAAIPAPGTAHAAGSVLDEERAFRTRKRTATTLPAVGAPRTGPITAPRTGPITAPRTAPITSAVPEPAGPSTVLIDVELDGGEDPAAADAAFREGTIVADRYRLVRRLGKGGMAQVFEARDLDLGETVAVKLHSSVLSSADLEMRFKREVTLSRQLAHPNIIRVYDIGRVRGHKYLTMELLTGNDLEQTLKERGGPVSARDAVAFLRQICAGLGAAHAVGVVHRDIKPGNFFVHQGTTLKLMDFGIARDMRQPSRTSPGLIMGTLEYMAPEQFKAFSDVTPAADLYAVGIMAFRMLAGHVPFRGSDVTTWAAEHASTPPPSLRALVPAVPAGLESVVMRLLEKDPARRFPSCDALAAALAPLGA